MKRRAVWAVFRRVWATAGVGATVVFVVWSLVAYRASPTGVEAAVSDATVIVERVEGVQRFESATGGGRCTFLFFPGALVDPRAYAPLVREVAAAGWDAVLIELPWRGAGGGADSPDLWDRVARGVAAARDPACIVLGGHSRGGVVAANVIARGEVAARGLVLIGTSHPRDVDLGGAGIPVLKIVGTRDGLASPPEVRQNAHLLPADTRWVWIEGGNHSQFGWYGFQPGDRRATIAAAEQRAIMTRAVLEMLAGVESTAVR